MTELILAGVIGALLALLAWKEIRHSVERSRWDKALRDAVDREPHTIETILERADRDRRVTLDHLDEQRRAWDVERGRYVAALLATRQVTPQTVATVKSAGVATTPAVPPPSQIDG